ncbi:MAG TPA: phosphatase PAP2 family protein [Ktedonobacteraceae bacterium]|nr:phosphatase PAP2 family protein [Ktedonobacteraceae bacterium]
MFWKSRQSKKTTATGPTVTAMGNTTDIASKVEENVKPVVDEAQRMAAQTSVSGRRAVSRGTMFLAFYLWLLSGAVILSLIAQRTQFFPGDKLITANLQRQRNPWFRRLMYAVSEIGFFEWSFPQTVGAAGIFWALRFRLEALFILLTSSSGMLNMLVKRLIKRPRPTKELVAVARVINEPSFPSGHVMQYINFYGLLIYLLATNWRSGRIRNILITICTALIICIGPSRIYLGAHWPSDVMAGYIYGGLWFSGIMALYLRVKSWIHPSVGKPPEIAKPLQQPGDNDDQ